MGDRSRNKEVDAGVEGGWMEGLTGARAPEFRGIAHSLRDRIDSMQI